MSKCPNSEIDSAGLSRSEIEEIIEHKTASDVETLKANLEVVEKAAHEPCGIDDTWGRSPGLMVLSVTAELVSKATLLESLEPWLARLNLPEEV